MAAYDAKPEAKDFKSPVKWLLGRQLLMGLKWIVLFAIFKGKLDPRDWMTGQQFPGPEELLADGATPQPDGTFTPEDLEGFWGPSDDGFWFDYLADSGDGQTATYTVAYLCSGNLSVTAAPGALPDTNSEVGFVADSATALPAGQRLLPRGQFLVVGGDTAYHIADYATLTERFQSPFRWAAEDHSRRHATGPEDFPPRRPLFGIPANHDYYDIIDGFNRQFRRPTSPDDMPNQEGRTPQLTIPGLERCQTASYFALRLPFDWHLWGLDCEVERLDVRQQEFFRSLAGEGGPAKLIVATPEPTTVFGKRARNSDDPYPSGANDRMAQAFKDLVLERPFLAGEPPLSPGKIRLDLSGDIHHYERYWGPSSGQDPDKVGPTTPPPASGNYASVVAGLGGAFLHPTQTYFGEIARQALYPNKQDSRRQIADSIFNFWQLIKEGYVWLVGIILAAVIFAAGTIFQSTAVIFRHVLEKLLGIPVVSTLVLGEISRTESVGGAELGFGLTKFGVGIRIAFLLLSLAALITALLYARRIFSYRIPETHEEWSSARTFRKGRRMIRYRDFLPLAALILFALASFLWGGWYFARHVPALPQFGASLMVFVTIGWALAALAASRLYSAWLDKLASSFTVTFYHHVPSGILTVAAVGILGAGIAIFGCHPAHYLVADLIFILLMTAIAVGLPAFGFAVGGSFSSGGGKVGLAVLGGWFSVLLLTTPFLLVAVGNWRALAIALVSIFVFRLLGMVLTKYDRPRLLLIVWLIFGGWMIFLPIAFRGPMLHWEPGVAQTLLLVGLAGLIGMFLTCVWFGWYLAVCLAFNGHNNEAGVAVTIEQFKQFVRIRLTENSLTAYVIGVDEPTTEGNTLRPKIVDVFTLRLKTAPNSALANIRPIRLG